MNFLNCSTAGGDGVIDCARGEHEVDKVGVVEVCGEEFDYWIVG